MENGNRKIGLRAIAGFLVAITIIVAVFASGIQLPGFQPETGKLSIYLKDAPVEVNALWINMTELQVHKTDDGDGEWISVDITDTFEEDEDWLEFDLLKYQNETVLELANASVITGTYNKIRLTVIGAEAWYWNDTVTVDENGYPDEGEDYTVQELRVPPNRIDVIIDFTIDSNAAVIVTIDMQPDWIAISESSNLRPVMKATVEYEELEIDQQEGVD